MQKWFHQHRLKAFFVGLFVIFSVLLNPVMSSQASSDQCLQALGTVSMSNGNVVFNMEVEGRYLLKVFGPDFDDLQEFTGSSYTLNAEQQSYFGHPDYRFVMFPLGSTRDQIPCLADYPYSPITDQEIDDIFDHLDCNGHNTDADDIAGLAVSVGAELADTTSNDNFNPDDSCDDTPDCPDVLQSAVDPDTNECVTYPSPCGVPAGWVLVNQCVNDFAHHFDIEGLTAMVNLGDTLNFNVLAEDFNNNRATDYTGTIRFASSDDTAVLPDDIIFPASSGGRISTSVTFNTPGVHDLSVYETTDFRVNGSVEVHVVRDLVCTPVTQAAVDPHGEECVEYATPCHVPVGWTRVPSCGGDLESCGIDADGDGDLLDPGEQCDNGHVDGMCYNNDTCNNCEIAPIIDCAPGAEFVCGECVMLESCGIDADGDGDLLDPGEQCDNGHVDGICYNNDGCDNCGIAPIIDCGPGFFFECGQCVPEGDVLDPNKVDLELRLAEGKSIFAPGERVTFNIYIENENEVPLRDVHVVGTLQPGFTFEYDDSFEGEVNINGNEFDISIEEVPAGVIEHYQYAWRVLEGDQAPEVGEYTTRVGMTAQSLEDIVSDEVSFNIVARVEGACRLPGSSQLDLASDGTHLYALIWEEAAYSQAVYKFNTDCEVLNTYPLAGTNTGFFGLTYDGTSFWGTGYGSHLHKFDENFGIVMTKYIGINDAFGAAFSDGLVYTIHNTGRSEVITTDIETNVTRFRFAGVPGDNPYGLAANEQALFVASGGNVYALNKNDGSVLAVIDMPSVDGYITGLTVLNNELWIIDNNDDHMYRVALPILDVPGTDPDPNGEDLQLELWGAFPLSGGVINRGDAISYEVYIRNNTDEDMHDVTVIDPLEAGYSFDRLVAIRQAMDGEAWGERRTDIEQSGNVRVEGGNIQMEIGTLRPGERALYKYSVLNEANSQDTVYRNQVLAYKNGDQNDFVKSNKVIHYILEDADFALNNNRLEGWPVSGGRWFLELCDNDNGCTDGRNVTVSNCGNNTVDTAESCDDGNRIDGDGCNRWCQVENFICGNGIVETSMIDYQGQEKDQICPEGTNLFNEYDVNMDGNVTREDAQLIINHLDRRESGVSLVPQPDDLYCYNVARQEDGSDEYISPLDALRVINAISRGDTGTPDCPAGATCSVEQCDDGNVFDGDGCSGSCQKEGDFNICHLVDLPQGYCCDANREEAIYRCDDQPSGLHARRTDLIGAQQNIRIGDDESLIIGVGFDNTTGEDVLVDQLQFRVKTSEEMTLNYLGSEAGMKLVMDEQIFTNPNVGILGIIQFDNLNVVIPAGGSRFFEFYSEVFDTVPDEFIQNLGDQSVVIKTRLESVEAYSQTDQSVVNAFEDGIAIGEGNADVGGDGDCFGGVADNYLCAGHVNVSKAECKTEFINCSANPEDPRCENIACFQAPCIIPFNTCDDQGGVTIELIAEPQEGTVINPGDDITYTYSITNNTSHAYVGTFSDRLDARLETRGENFSQTGQASNELSLGVVSGGPINMDATFTVGPKPVSGSMGPHQPHYATFRFPLRLKLDADVSTPFVQGDESTISMDSNTGGEPIATSFNTLTHPVEGRICGQAITPAVSPDGSECVTYPNTCIPEGWNRVSSCEIDMRASMLYDPVQNTTLQPGDEVVYTYGVGNDSAFNLANVLLTDTLDPRLELNGDVTATGSTQHQIGVITDGDSIELSAQLRIEADPIFSGSDDDFDEATVRLPLRVKLEADTTTAIEHGPNVSLTGHAVGYPVIAIDETFPKLEHPLEDRACGDAITYAVDQNGENCTEYSTTCIPEGWEVVEDCDDQPQDSTHTLRVTRNDQLGDEDTIILGSDNVEVLGFNVLNDSFGPSVVNTFDFALAGGAENLDPSKLEASLMQNGNVIAGPINPSNAGVLMFEELNIQIDAASSQDFQVLVNTNVDVLGTNLTESWVKFRLAFVAFTGGMEQQVLEGNIELGNGIPDPDGDGDCIGGTGSNFLCGATINLVIPDGWFNTPNDTTSCEDTCNAFGKTTASDEDGYSCLSGLDRKVGLASIVDYRHGCEGDCDQASGAAPTEHMMVDGQNLCAGQEVVGDENTPENQSISVSCYCE